LVDFRRGQPFSLYSKEKMEEMKQSISRNGLFVPITVRIIEDDKYEILAGHNRVRCCRELGYDNIPANIVECDDDRATLIMLETNLYQRDNIPLTEKGEAYKQRLEILLRQEKGGDHNGHERKIERLADISADSKTQIQRLIRLSYLIKEFKEKLNNNEVSFLVGVELSYLKDSEQIIIYNLIDLLKCKISTKQAEKLRELKDTLNEENIKNILISNSREPKDVKFTGRLTKINLKKYKNKFKGDIEFNVVVNKLLEQYFKDK
jgi:ParB family chromosome partitioning protein